MQASAEQQPGKGPPLSSLLVLPTGLHHGHFRTSFELESQTKKRKSPRKVRQSQPSHQEPDLYDSKNYLVRGGQRAYEQKIQNMNRAAIQDLRAANDALASELLRLRSASEEGFESLRASNTRLELELRTEQEKLKLMTGRLAEEAKARADMEASHQSRLKEVTKRCRDEHNGRAAAEALASQLKQQVTSLEGTTQLVGELRSGLGRLEATVAGDAAIISDLRSRLATAETKLETEMEAKGDLAGRYRSAELQLSNLSERNAEQSASLSESEARGRAACAKLEALEDAQEATKHALQQERDAHGRLRERCSRLEADLTELQASSALASAQAAADKTELERLRREYSEATQRVVSSSEEIAGLREEAMFLRSEAAGLKLSHDSARQEVELLRERVERMSTMLYQSENHERVFAENEALMARVQRSESSLRQKEAVLAEAVTSHNAQLEMWRAEATDVAQAASKWKQRALLLQQQVDEQGQERGRISDDMQALSSRCVSAEADRARLTEVVTTLEGRLAQAQQELTVLRSQANESLASQAAAVRQADSATHEAAAREASLDRLSARLAEETAKSSSLRQDLAALTQQHVKELDAKARMLGELTMALQREERARSASEHEATSLRGHLQTLERELRNAQVALSSIGDEKMRTEEAYEAAEAALRSAQRRAKHYKKEAKV